MTIYRMRLPWAKPPINANDRHHWRRKAQIVAEIRSTVTSLVALGTYSGFTLPVEAGHITVGLHYWPRDNRRRDADNLVVPLFKALVDGLVDARVVVDDDDSHVTRTMPVIHPADGDPRLELWVEVP
jgi:crossover junction endodeoxyribonuclease RusA